MLYSLDFSLTFFCLICLIGNPKNLYCLISFIRNFIVKYSNLENLFFRSSLIWSPTLSLNPVEHLLIFISLSSKTFYCLMSRDPTNIYCLLSFTWSPEKLYCIGSYLEHWLWWGLTTHQHLWVILCRLLEQGRKGIEESRDEREGQGRKKNRNENEETEEIKTSPFTLTCYKDNRSCPTVSQYQLDAPVTLDTRHLRHTRPSDPAYLEHKGNCFISLILSPKILYCVTAYHSYLR